MAFLVSWLVTLFSAYAGGFVIVLATHGGAWIALQITDSADG
jgi:hypothetical protein